MNTKAREFWILTDGRTWEVIGENKTKAEIAHTDQGGKLFHTREVLPSEESELVELRKDRERLDWVIKYSGRISLNWGIATEHKNFREAIDAAMEIVK